MKIHEEILELVRHSTAKTIWKTELYLTSHLPLQISKEVISRCLYLGWKRLIVLALLFLLWSRNYETAYFKLLALNKQVMLIVISDRQGLPGGKLGADEKGFKSL